jgi:8-oxo-dGTP diphosphatase
MGAAVTVSRVRVVAAFLVRGGMLLVQQRAPSGPRGLLWELPGGKVEPGETDAQALERECREEMGVDVAVGEKLGENVHAYSDLEIELVIYRCRLRLEAEPKALRANAVRFVRADELETLAFCAADRPLLDQLAAGL